MNLIVAMNEHDVIGDGSKLLWNIPEDLKRFKDLTLGQVVIMGRKTFESLPFKYGLPSRINIVLTRDPEKYSKMNIGNTLHFVTENDLDNVLTKYAPHGKRIFVIGGREIYEKLLPRCNMAYITAVYHHDTKDGVKFECEMNEFIKIHESSIFPSKNLEYQYFVYMRNK
jgi:dihydrofolate reductase